MHNRGVMANYSENSGNTVKTRRKRNTESVINERKRLKVYGKAYITSSGVPVPEKRAPADIVIKHNLQVSMSNRVFFCVLGKLQM